MRVKCSSGDRKVMYVLWQHFRAVEISIGSRWPSIQGEQREVREGFRSDVVY